jgi:hypothetical protein
MVFDFLNQSLNFYACVFIEVIVVIAFYLQCQLLFRCLKVGSSDRMSTILMINITFWCFNAFFILCFYTYFIPFIDSSDKNGIYMSLTALLTSASSVGVSLSTNALCLERILIVVRSRVHTHYRHEFVLVIATLCILVTESIFATSMWQTLPFSVSTSEFNEVSLIVLQNARHSNVR